VTNNSARTFGFSISERCAAQLARAINLRNRSGRLCSALHKRGASMESVRPDPTERALELSVLFVT
jgi:hypothetical protein